MGNPHTWKYHLYIETGPWSMAILPMSNELYWLCLKIGQHDSSVNAQQSDLPPFKSIMSRPTIHAEPFPQPVITRSHAHIIQGPTWSAYVTKDHSVFNSNSKQNPLFCHSIPVNQITTKVITCRNSYPAMTCAKFHHNRVWTAWISMESEFCMENH